MTTKQFFARYCVLSWLAATSLLSFTAIDAASAAENSPKRIAILDFELIDSSLQGEIEGARKDEQQRLLLISQKLRELLEQSEKYQVINQSDAQEMIDQAGYIHTCNKCTARIGEKLEVVEVFTGTVQKVSNLILNLNVYIHDVESEKLVSSMSVDIRSNTDRSWIRGITYIAKNRILN